MPSTSTGIEAWALHVGWICQSQSGTKGFSWVLQFSSLCKLDFHAKIWAVEWLNISLWLGRMGNHFLHSWCYVMLNKVFIYYFSRQRSVSTCAFLTYLFLWLTGLPSDKIKRRLSKLLIYWLVFMMDDILNLSVIISLQYAFRWMR